jgi:hypothetical protein
MPFKQLVLIDRRRKEELKKLQAKTQASRNASTQLRLFSCVDKKYIKGDMLK